MFCLTFLLKHCNSNLHQGWRDKLIQKERVQRKLDHSHMLRCQLLFSFRPETYKCYHKHVMFIIPCFLKDACLFREYT